VLLQADQTTLAQAHAEQPLPRRRPVIDADGDSPEARPATRRFPPRHLVLILLAGLTVACALNVERIIGPDVPVILTDMRVQVPRRWADNPQAKHAAAAINAVLETDRTGDQISRALSIAAAQRMTVEDPVLSEWLACQIDALAIEFRTEMPSAHRR